MYNPVSCNNLEWSSDHLVDWFHETNVCNAIAKHLLCDGFQVRQAKLKDKGVDILASSKKENILVEVKGYPSIYHTKGKNKGSIKATDPKLQSHHWFQEALVTVLSRYSLYRETENLKLAIGFPNISRYHDLINNLCPFFIDHNIDLRVYFVDSNGQVSVSSMKGQLDSFND
jgi:hypothetical protein